MKKYIIYIAMLLLGLTLGWLMFGNSTKAEKILMEDSSESKKIGAIWTCSMHPQIRLSEPGDCPICGMNLISLETNSTSNPLVFKMTEDAIKIANIQTTVIGSVNVKVNGLKLSGKIQADETTSSSIVSHVSGRIEKLFVSYTGEKVNRGQKIASIYSPKLITAQKELLEAYKVKDINPKLYEATVNKLKFWKLTDNQIQAIVTSDKVMESFNIFAGYSGVVLNKKVSVGDYLNEGEVLFDIQNLNQLWAVFDVYEKDFGSIKTGTKISFTSSAIPNMTYTSSISFVDPVINPNTRTATVRATISNKRQLLKPEMFIEGMVMKRINKNKTLSVPKSAVLWTGERSVVYVKLPDLDIPSFEFREVTIGSASGSNYLILKGLENGEEVVTNGAFVIDASSQLNNQPSMMNRNLVNKDNIQSFQLPDFTSNTPDLFKAQLTTLANTYFLVKDALVESNGKKAISTTKEVLNKVKKVDMSLVKGEAHIYWMEQLKAIQLHGKKIIEFDDLEEQRKQFDFLSQAFIKSLKVFGVDKDTFYVQHCPMVNDNDGADWLSKHEKILNPYFGEKMLSCGTVMDTIDLNFRNPPKQIQSKVKLNVHKH